MKNKTLGYILLVFLIFYTILIGIFADNISNYAVNQNPIIQEILYYLTQTQFILILIGTTYIGILHKRVVAGVSAGILIDLFSDMTSFPHCVLKTGFIANAPNLSLCSDTIFIRWTDTFLTHSMSYAIYYYILPVIFLIIAFELLGSTKFLKDLFGW